MLAAQTLLVATGRAYVHRRLGWLAVVLVPGVVVTSLVTMQRVAPRIIEARGAIDARAQAPIFERMAEVVFYDSWTLIVFVSFVACALYFRSRPDTHKRLMFLASAKLIAPALSAGCPIGVLVTPYLYGVLASTVFVCLCMAALVWHDLATKRRLEPVTIWGSAAIVAVLVVSFVMTNSEFGIALTRWVAGVD